MSEREQSRKKSNLRVINIGLQRFYEALVSQGIKIVQLEWRPPVKQSEEIAKLLDKFM